MYLLFYNHGSSVNEQNVRSAGEVYAPYDVKQFKEHTVRTKMAGH